MVWTQKQRIATTLTLDCSTAENMKILENQSRPTTLLMDPTSGLWSSCSLLHGICRHLGNGMKMDLLEQLVTTLKTSTRCRTNSAFTPLGTSSEMMSISSSLTPGHSMQIKRCKPLPSSSSLSYMFTSAPQKQHWLVIVAFSPMHFVQFRHHQICSTTPRQPSWLWAITVRLWLWTNDCKMETFQNLCTGTCWRFLQGP